MTAAPDASGGNLWTLSFSVNASSSESAPISLAAVVVQLAHPDGSVFDEVELAPDKTLGPGQTTSVVEMQSIQSPDRPQAAGTESNWVWTAPLLAACTVTKD